MPYSVRRYPKIRTTPESPDAAQGSSVPATSDRHSMAGIPHHTKTSYNYVKIDEHK
ncbi:MULTISPECIES: hypothetical protein [unclassified Microcoleus]|uniref:hypothetical protein n=1 Tax=unclassified Microcoleus TaxID=2642155 RepID=UPI002FD40F47